jgi:hypothetical protein
MFHNFLKKNWDLKKQNGSAQMRVSFLAAEEPDALEAEEPDALESEDQINLENQVSIQKIKEIPIEAKEKEEAAQEEKEEIPGEEEINLESPISSRELKEIPVAQLRSTEVIHDYLDEQIRGGNLNDQCSYGNCPCGHCCVAFMCGIPIDFGLVLCLENSGIYLSSFGIVGISLGTACVMSCLTPLSVCLFECLRQQMLPFLTRVSDLPPEQKQVLENELLDIKPTESLWSAGKKVSAQQRELHDQWNIASSIVSNLNKFGFMRGTPQRQLVLEYALSSQENKSTIINTLCVIQNNGEHKNVLRPKK